MPGARDVLYGATRTVHADLERAFPLAAPELTLARYVATLQRTCSVYAVLEDALGHHAAALVRLDIDWEERRKLPLLRRDLEYLGHAVPQPSARPGPGLTSLPEALGCLYVLEGATLGGKRIARAVARVLGLDPDSGAAFFHGYADATAARWRELCAALDAGLGDATDREQAVAAALATFAHVAAGEPPDRNDVGRTANA